MYFQDHTACSAWIFSCNCSNRPYLKMRKSLGRLYWHVRCLLLGCFFANIGIAMVMGIHHKGPNLHKLGVFWRNYTAQRTQFEENWVFFLQNWYWWVSEWSGVARAGPPPAHPEDQNEEENLRKNERNCRKMRDWLRKYSYLAHLGVRSWLRPQMVVNVDEKVKIEASRYDFSSKNKWNSATSLLNEQFILIQCRWRYVIFSADQARVFLTLFGDFGLDLWFHAPGPYKSELYINHI